MDNTRDFYSFDSGSIPDKPSKLIYYKLLRGQTMLYIKAMKQDGTYQILEADGYVEFLKKDVGDKQAVQQAVEVVFNYYDVDGILRNGRHWLEGDCFIMNDKGFTVSAYHYKP